MSRLIVKIAAATAVLAAMTVPADAGVDVHIDKSTQRMYVAVDGVTRYVWAVSTGAAGYETPGGSFRPFRMERDHFSREWDNAPMPYSIFFTEEGHAIHGSTHTRSLGRPASHGCVRLAPGEAAKLFDLVAQNGLEETSISISGAYAYAAPPPAGEVTGGNTSVPPGRRVTGSYPAAAPPAGAAYPPASFPLAGDVVDATTVY